MKAIDNKLSEQIMIENEANYCKNLKNTTDLKNTNNAACIGKSISESNLLSWIKTSKNSFKIPAKHSGKSFLISRGIYKYKNPIDEIFPSFITNDGLSGNELNAMQRSISMENMSHLCSTFNESKKCDISFKDSYATVSSIQNNSSQEKETKNQNQTKFSPTMVINEEGEIIQGSVISPLISPPRSRCVFIGEFTRECVFNVLRISHKWDYPLKYVIGFHSYFIKSCCQMLKSHINQFTSSGAFINGVFPELLERIKHDLKDRNYCLCVDISSIEELEQVEPLLRNAGAYIICSKLPMLSRLASYTDYLFVSRNAGISKQYEANLRKKSMCMVATRNMLKYSMGYKLSILSYYLDKLEENEYIVAVNPFNSIVLNLWYLPYWKGFKLGESSQVYYPIGCIMGYFSAGGNSHRKTIKSYYLKNYRAKKMQNVIAERGNPLSFLYKDYLPKDIFLVIFTLSFAFDL